jgi:LPS-assembly protein
MFRPIATLALVVLAIASPSAAQDNPFSNCKRAEPIRALRQTPEPIEGRPGNWRYVFEGAPVVVVCDDTILQANKIEWESDTHAIRATGEVTLQQPTLTLSADRAELDGNTNLGTFYNAAGQARLGDEPDKKSPFGTVEPDVIFWGEYIEKTSEKSYRIHRGGFTTCAQPTPRWEMTMGDATVTLDKRAILRSVVLKVKDVPLLYLPAFYYPMDEQGRSTGFLLPTYTNSTYQGTSLSNAFFWAINRSQDATFYHDWTTKSGQGGRVDYRYVRSPDSRGNATFHIFQTPEILTTAASRSIQINGDANQWLPGGFRMNGRINYFSNSTTQQLYQDVYNSVQHHQRSYSASITGGFRHLRLNANLDQTDYFYGGDEQRSGRLPTINIAVPDRAIGRSRVYVGTTGEAAYLLNKVLPRDPDAAETDSSLWRFDSTSRIRAPLSTLSFLSVTADASWRITHWRESYDLSDPERPVQVPVGLTRHLLSTVVNATGPTFSRIFQKPNGKYADAFKHIIEPTFTVTRESSFRDADRIVGNDFNVDRPSMTKVDYGIANKIMARRPAPAGPPGSPPRPGVTRQIASVTIRQSYYSDASALNYDGLYSVKSSEPVRFSPMNIQAAFRPADTIVGSFDMFIDPKTKAITNMNASSRIERERVDVDVRWIKVFNVKDLPSFQTGYEQLNGSTTIRSRRNTVGGTYAFTIDVENRKWLQQRIMGYYNSQCCGINIEWQSSSTFIQGLPSNRLFSVSFTLAGIGSFANPLGSFGGGG